jgi:hypothetical protein
VSDATERAREHLGRRAYLDSKADYVRFLEWLSELSANHVAALDYIDALEGAPSKWAEDDEFRIHDLHTEAKRKFEEAINE